MSRFTGFPPEGFAFFHQLAICQDREWFKAHKAAYEELWLAPMTALFDELHLALRPLFPQLAKTRPRVFRIYRDVRFGKDKTPFKTSIAALLPLFSGAPTPEGGTGLYCDFGDEPFVAAGRWMMDGPALARFRQRVLADATGVPLARAVAAVTKAGFSVGSHQVLKRPPPGVDGAHPRVALLKQKGFALTFPRLEPARLADGRKLVARLKGQVKTAAPLLRWVEAVARGGPLPALGPSARGLTTG